MPKSRLTGARPAACSFFAFIERDARIWVMSIPDAKSRLRRLVFRASSLMPAVSVPLAEKARSFACRDADISCTALSSCVTLIPRSRLPAPFMSGFSRLSRLKSEMPSLREPSMKDRGTELSLLPVSPPASSNASFLDAIAGMTGSPLPASKREGASANAILPARANPGPEASGITVN